MAESQSSHGVHTVRLTHLKPDLGVVEHGDRPPGRRLVIVDLPREVEFRPAPHQDTTVQLAENLLEECDAYSFEEFVPEWLKPYVKINVELLARYSEIELYVVEGRGGGVFVFDGRG